MSEKAREIIPTVKEETALEGQILDSETEAKEDDFERGKIGIQLVNDCLITEPDIECLPRKSYEEIKKMLAEGVFCETEEEAEEKARGLSMDLYKTEDLLFHSLFYDTSYSKNENEATILNAVSRGLVSYEYDIVKPKRDVPKASTGVNGSNQISVYDPWKFYKSIKENVENNTFTHHGFVVCRAAYGGFNEKELILQEDPESGLLLSDKEGAQKDFTWRVFKFRKPDDGINLINYLDQKKAIGRYTGKPKEAMLDFYRAGGREKLNKLNDYLKSNFKTDQKELITVDQVPTEYQDIFPFLVADLNNDIPRMLAQGEGRRFPGHYFFIPEEKTEKTEDYLANLKDDQTREECKKTLEHITKKLYPNKEEILEKGLNEAIRHGQITLVIKINQKIRNQKVSYDGRGTPGESFVYGHVLPWEIVGVIAPTGNKDSTWKKDSEGKYKARVALDVAKRVGLPVYNSAGKVIWPKQKLAEEK